VWGSTHPPVQLGFRGFFPNCKVARARSYTVKLNYWSYTSASPIYLYNTALKQVREQYTFSFALLELAVFYGLSSGYCTCKIYAKSGKGSNFESMKSFVLPAYLLHYEQFVRTARYSLTQEPPTLAPTTVYLWYSSIFKLQMTTILPGRTHRLSR